MHRLPRPIEAGIDRIKAAVRRVSRHDLVLAVIPAAFLVAALLGVALDVEPTTAVGAAAGFSALAVLDALFVNPPRRPSAGRPPA